jgi:hypothetical protein
MLTETKTPPEGWDVWKAKREREGGNVEHDDNQPESRNLTNEERQIFDNARAAVDVIKKTYDTWLMIARGVECARNHANKISDGKRSRVFERILEQQGLSGVLGNTPGSVKSTASTLLRILEHELEVGAWRRSLTAWERQKYSSPTAVLKHCPVFQEQAELDGAKKEKPNKLTKDDEIKELKAQLAHAQEELAPHDAPALPSLMWRDDRVIDMNGDVQDIVAAMRTLDADKAKEVARAFIGEPEPKPGKAGKSKAKGLKRFLDDWKPIREALKDPEALSPEERQEFLDLIAYDLGEAKAEGTALPSPTTPTVEEAPTPIKPEPASRCAAPGRTGPGDVPDASKEAQFRRTQGRRRRPRRSPR